MPCRINVFSGRKRERSPRENTPNGDFGGFSPGDLSPRQAKKRQTGGEKATHEKCRTLADKCSFIAWTTRILFE